MLVVRDSVMPPYPWLFHGSPSQHKWLEARAGIEPAHEQFLVRVLDALGDPDLPEWLVVGCAVTACGQW
jgi:hypothetical protein